MLVGCKSEEERKEIKEQARLEEIEDLLEAATKTEILELVNELGTINHEDRIDILFALAEDSEDSEVFIASLDVLFVIDSDDVFKQIIDLYDHISNLKKSIMLDKLNYFVDQDVTSIMISELSDVDEDLRDKAGDTLIERIQKYDMFSLVLGEIKSKELYKTSDIVDVIILESYSTGYITVNELLETFDDSDIDYNNYIGELINGMIIANEDIMNELTTIFLADGICSNRVLDVLNHSNSYNPYNIFRLFDVVFSDQNYDYEFIDRQTVNSNLFEADMLLKYLSGEPNDMIINTVDYMIRQSVEQSEDPLSVFYSDAINFFGDNPNQILLNVFFGILLGYDNPSESYNNNNVLESWKDGYTLALEYEVSSYTELLLYALYYGVSIDNETIINESKDRLYAVINSANIRTYSSILSSYQRTYDSNSETTVFFKELIDQFFNADVLNAIYEPYIDSDYPYFSYDEYSIEPSRLVILNLPDDFGVVRYSTMNELVPDDLYAYTPEFVRYTICFKPWYTFYGTYDGYYAGTVIEAYREDYEVILYDYYNDEIISSRTFIGGAPPDEITVTTYTPSVMTGIMDYEPIYDYIADLIADL